MFIFIFVGPLYVKKSIWFHLLKVVTIVYIVMVGFYRVFSFKCFAAKLKIRCRRQWTWRTRRTLNPWVRVLFIRLILFEMVYLHRWHLVVSHFVNHLKWRFCPHLWSIEFLRRWYMLRRVGLLWLLQYFLRYAYLFFYLINI
jgi:hypothetical protein